MSRNPDEIVNEIRSIQASLTQLQHQVIRGEVTPAEYQQTEKERVERIHVLEAELSALMGTPQPERDPGK